MTRDKNDIHKSENIINNEISKSDNETPILQEYFKMSCNFGFAHLMLLEIEFYF